jgi:hypothetical protein
MAKKRKIGKVQETEVTEAANPAVTKPLGTGTIRVLINDKLESQPIADGDNAVERSIQYHIFIDNTSSDWTIVGWSYTPDHDQIWNALKNGWVYPNETGLVLTRENYDSFQIYFIARKNPGNPTDPVCYSPVADVTPDPSYPGSTLPWSGC